MDTGDFNIGGNKMKLELQKKLFEKYPKIFADKDKSMKETAMCWGIETGDGWYSLINCLCGQIQAECDRLGDNYQVVASQVKEKLGGLRFYTNCSTDTIEGYISFAVSLSYYICEKCGKMDRTVTQTRGWIITLCECCRNKRSEHKNEA